MSSGGITWALSDLNLAGISLKDWEKPNFRVASPWAISLKTMLPVEGCLASLLLRFPLWKRPAVQRPSRKRTGYWLSLLDHILLPTRGPFCREKLKLKKCTINVYLSMYNHFCANISSRLQRFCLYGGNICGWILGAQRVLLFSFRLHCGKTSLGVPPGYMGSP